MNASSVERQVDAVEGDDLAKPFGDSDQFDRRLLIDGLAVIRPARGRISLRHTPHP